MAKRKIKKNVQKNNIHYDNNKTYYNEQLKKLGIIIGVLLGIFIIIYLIIGIFVTKEIKLFNNNEEVKAEATIQYSKILAGETFSQKDGEYYVIFADTESVNYTTYQLLINNKTDKNIYTVDMDNPMNQKYVSEESNRNANSVSELKIKGDTMIKISNNKNVGYYEGVSSILEELK